jgi:7-cyano-7-deazaguanine synthase in queuosine biosynthesis
MRRFDTRPETHIHINTSLIRLGQELKALLEITLSCYRNESRACGR